MGEEPPRRRPGARPIGDGLTYYQRRVKRALEAGYPSYWAYRKAKAAARASQESTGRRSP